MTRELGPSCAGACGAPSVRSVRPPGGFGSAPAHIYMLYLYRYRYIYIYRCRRRYKYRFRYRCTYRYMAVKKASTPLRTGLPGRPKSQETRWQEESQGADSGRIVWEVMGSQHACWDPYNVPMLQNSLPKGAWAPGLTGLNSPQ